MSDILQLCNKNTICNITKVVIVELNIVKILCVKDYFKGYWILKDTYFTLQYKTAIFQHYK